ncbi:MAG: cation:proton antiporter [Pseudomonadota bacterium]
MDFEWVAIGLSDVAWIALAFALGLLSRLAGLPPLVGYLAAGFFLSTQGISDSTLIQKLSDLGITLLLFTVGLKIDLRTLTRPQVWAVSGLHMLIIVVAFSLAIYGLALSGAALFADLDRSTSILIAFALSFSSTVFAVKVLEEKGEMNSLQGQIAIGILIIQDIAAVTFLAVSAGAVPSPFAPALLLLIPLRPVLHLLLQRVGHGELMVLYGFLLALGGAEVFQLFEMKGDLGALVLGVLIANHPKAEEMAKLMLNFKDLFLIGFFLSIGLSGELTVSTLLVGAAIAPLALLKSILFFGLLTRFKLRARTALRVSMNLANYSEFGLIVAAIGVANGWIDTGWLVAISVALSLSFAIAAGLNRSFHWLYANHRPFWKRWQTVDRLPDDRRLDIGGAKVAVIGMGGVGTGAYDTMRRAHDGALVGIDINPVTAGIHWDAGRNVLLGDPSDADFWDRVQESHQLELVMLALPKLATSLSVLRRLREVSFQGHVAAIARYTDEVEALENAGAETVYNIYTEAGTGFAAHVETQDIPLLKKATS